MAMFDVPEIFLCRLNARLTVVFVEKASRPVVLLMVEAHCGRCWLQKFGTPGA
jgi:hypothetical protein